MVALRNVFVSLSLGLSIGLLLPGTSLAQPSYYDANCSSCHGAAPASPRTCNGCHAHGAHASGARASMNLVAKTDKSSYVVGDTIKVTLSSGMQPQSAGWVGIRAYDANGTEVSVRQRDNHCSRIPGDATTPCDLSLDISITAQAGWTALYVAWAGNVFDASSAMMGDPVTGPIGIGNRALKDKAGNQIANHVEEIVKATFTVTGSGATQPSAGGGGSWDWILLSALIALSFLRRRNELQ